jgi:dUTP pyrophosphatase
MSNLYKYTDQHKLHDKLLQIYDKYMLLKIYPDTNDENLKQKYVATAEARSKQLLENPRMIDAGYDLFAPANINEDSDKTQLVFYGHGRKDKTALNKLDHNIICSAKIYTDIGKSYNTGYYLHPRSSLSKTRLRLANSTGIVDAGYRGHIIAMLDVLNMNNEDYIGQAYDRYVQICAPSLMPIVVQVVDTMEELGEETARGDGAFGSTGR